VAYLDQRVQRWDPWVLQITSNLEFRLRGRELRGERWNLWRDPGRGKTGEVCGEYLDRVAVEKLPPSFSIVTPLQRTLATVQLFLGAPNPIPVPLILDLFKVDLPAIAASQDTEVKTADVGAFKERLKAMGRNRGQGPNGTVKYT
jgi:hypothetical protein